MITSQHRISTPLPIQLNLDFNSGCIVNAHKIEAFRLEFIKNNLKTKTNQQLANALNISVHAVHNLMRKYKCYRTPAEVSKLKSDLRSQQIGSLNFNWRGGISKNFMRYKRRQLEKHPDRVRARMIAYDALRSGKIEKKPCELCLNEKSEMHHEDHSKPLEVIFLCRTHHIAADKYLRLGIKFSEIKEQLKAA